jgi:hypothetical protein
VTIHNPNHPAIQNLLTSKEVIKSQRTREPMCGIYFLLLDNQIVYVGQTKNLHSRLTQHDRTKEFDAYHFEPCRKEYLDRREAAYIEAMRPRLNNTKPRILHNDFPPPLQQRW